MTTTTNKSPSSECCIIASTGLCVASLVVSFICYIVFAILYLVQDYNVWNDCESNSYLWPYVLVAIILSLINCLKNLETLFKYVFNQLYYDEPSSTREENRGIVSANYYT
jgi:hypothetical protein